MAANVETMFSVREKPWHGLGRVVIEAPTSKDALKFLAKLDKKSVDRIREAITGLTLVPPVGDIKLLQGYNDDRKRLRVGSWRIIYKYGLDNNIEILFIIDIGNRGDIYK